MNSLWFKQQQQNFSYLVCVVGFFFPVAFGPQCSCGYRVQITSSVISERLSGWWKHVMKWCDITSVDEPTAKLWPDATSLLLTDWMIDSWDMELLIDSTHWQTGTLKGHVSGDMSTSVSGKWHMEWVYLLSIQNGKCVGWGRCGHYHLSLCKILTAWIK